jgi:endonuclease-3
MIQGKVPRIEEGVMKRMTKKERERIDQILECLKREYGTEYTCYLTHKNAWQLLIATILSAQCTDARVNIVTKDLFVKYPDLESFAAADLKELEKDIHSTGFYHNKAKNIIACTKALVEEHQGEVPSDLESLTKLAGVGRKTANVIRGNIFHQPSIVVDTHVKRISKKLGLTNETDPVKVEYELMKVLPEDFWILWNIHIIRLGRTICTARSPQCKECFLKELCKDYQARERRAARFTKKKAEA